MKCILFALTCCILFVKCGYEFPTQYARIGETARNIVFVYDNNGLAEGAPGDIVGVNAYFAGERISDAQWSVSTGVVYGTILEKDSLTDSINLSELMVPGSYRESHGVTGDTLHFDIMIPQNIIRKQYNGVVSMASLMPSELDKKSIDVLEKISPHEIIDIIETIVDNGEVLEENTVNSIVYSVFNDTTDNAWRLFALTLQALTVNMRLFVRVNGTHEVESVFSVRYNHKLKGFDKQITVNRNPEIYQVLLKVKDHRSANSETFDSVFVLGENQENIIDINENCEYYLTVSLNGAVYDTGMEYNVNGQRNGEEYLIEWFYKSWSTLTNSNNADSEFYIEKKIGSSHVRLFPPKNIADEKFCIWVVATDYFFGERLRPSGFATKAIYGKFRKPLPLSDS